MPTLTRKTQHLRVSMNFYTVRNDILKLWCLTLDFTLTLLDIFVCLHPVAKRKIAYRIRISSQKDHQIKNRMFYNASFKSGWPI